MTARTIRIILFIAFLSAVPDLSGAVGKLIFTEREIQAGDSLVWEVPDNCFRAVSMAIDIPDIERTEHDVCWNFAVGNSMAETYVRIEIVNPALAYSESGTEVRVTSFGAGIPDGMNENLVIRNEEMPWGVAFFLHDRRTLEVALGGETLQEVFMLPSEGEIERVMFSPDVTSTVKSLNYKSECDIVPTPRLFENSESVISVLEGSDDPVEGVYEYLDSDISTASARLGGRYRVALVRDDESAGSYNIIYLSGGDRNGNAWLDGMLKGELKPTRFVGHYDLEWTDADFSRKTEDCWARLDKGILELNFPHEKSVIRFSIK